MATTAGNTARRIINAPLERLDDLGHQLSFYFRTFAWTPRVVRRYRSEVLRLLAEVSLGTGGLAVIGGSVAIVAFMTFFVGTEVGLQGYTALNQIGTAAFSGFVSSYANTRELAPIVSALALSATVGCGFTAQLGAMRISDEIDALEVMGINSLTFLVCTRVVATLIALIPLYLLALFASFFATRLISVEFFAVSPGIYDHYFHLYLPPIDVFYSVVKVFVFTFIIIVIHCYRGFYARGGPVGVGVATGRAIRESMVTIIMVNLLLSYIFWGHGGTVSLTG